MRRKLPSTQALIAFESAARHGSFTRAAEEMAVTQSAVCRQVAALENFLQIKLFRRTRRGVALTRAGQQYSLRVTASLDTLEQDAFDLMACGTRSDPLELAVVPTFATRWLLPRLSHFMNAHPDISVNLTPNTRPFLFGDHAFDAAIYAGEANWPGTEAVFLMTETLLAVASPALAQQHPVRTAADFARLPLLQQATRPYAWRNWLGSQGVRLQNDLAGPRMELFSMLADAAIHGLGAALIPPFLIEDELRRGVLTVLLEHEFPSDRSYYLLYPEQHGELPALKTFRHWLQKQAGEEGTR